MNNSDSLFPLEPIVRQRGSYMVRNLRLISDAVCEASVDFADDPEDVVTYMAGAFDGFPDQEQVWVILLNVRNRIIGRQLVSVGTASQTLVGTSEVFRAAIIGGAAAIVMVHNHPSGDPSPSTADFRITQAIRAAAEVVKIIFFDHVIIGSLSADPLGLGHYSFRSAGRL